MQRFALVFVLLVTTGATWACAGASFANGIYDDGIVRYRVGPRGPHWKRVEVEDNDLAFHDPAVGTVSVNSTCEDYEDVPQAALMNHLLMGTTERRFRIEETVTVDGRGARHVIADVELDGVPVTLEVFLLNRDGCVYDIVYTAAREVHERERGAFLAFVNGFQVLETNLDD
jgi:hypothetical protein